jgi:hypothetical protein
VQGMDHTCNLNYIDDVGFQDGAGVQGVRDVSILDYIDD